jgi:hypothetical protein
MDEVAKRLLKAGMAKPFPAPTPTTKRTHKTMDQTSDGRYRYDIYLDEDVHWVLVELGARSKMHQEDYVEQVLTEYACLALERRNTTTEPNDDDMGEQAKD